MERERKRERTLASLQACARMCERVYEEQVLRIHFACAIRTLFMIAIVLFFFFSFLFFFFLFFSLQKRYVIADH